MTGAYGKPSQLVGPELPVTSGTGWVTGSFLPVGVVRESSTALGRLMVDAITNVVVSGLTVAVKVDVADLTGHYCFDYAATSGLNVEWPFTRTEANAWCGGSASRFTVTAVTGDAWVDFNRSVVSGSAMYLRQGESYSEQEVYVTGVSVMSAAMTGDAVHVRGVMWGGK